MIFENMVYTSLLQAMIADRVETEIALDQSRFGGVAIRFFAVISTSGLQRSVF